MDHHQAIVKTELEIAEALLRSARLSWEGRQPSEALARMKSTVRHLETAIALAHRGLARPGQ
jgi:hypothetical protein